MLARSIENHSHSRIIHIKILQREYRCVTHIDACSWRLLTITTGDCDSRMAAALFHYESMSHLTLHSLFCRVLLLAVSTTRLMRVFHSRQMPEHDQTAKLQFNGAMSCRRMTRRTYIKANSGSTLAPLGIALSHPGDAARPMRE